MKKIITYLQEFIRDDDIKPLGEKERYRSVFVQEIGGFSLRCIVGMQELRQSYQDWKNPIYSGKKSR